MIANGVAIEVKDLWKRFIIPHEKRSTVFEAITEIFRKTGYEEFWALRDINFSIKKGEFVGIIGENGSGKTTLLNLIANILRPTKGEISVNGNITSFLELGVGFQPDLTARENIYLYSAIMGLSDKEIDDRLDEIFEFSGLRKFEDTKLKNFSSGMYVRLAFSTAIQTNPEILLIDEVLAVGDMEFQQKCFEKFDEFKREGLTMLLVSHDIGMIEKFCDCALYLSHGKQIAFGETHKIIDRYVSKNIWENTSKFILENKRDNDIIVAPNEFSSLLGTIVSDTSVRKIGDVFKRNNDIIHPDWFVLHKGGLNQLDPELLNFVVTKMKAVFANEVFVIFTKERDLPEIDKERDDYKALFENMKNIGLKFF